MVQQSAHQKRNSLARCHAHSIQQEQQQAQMMAMAQAAIPNATKGAMDAMNQQAQGGSEDNG